MKGSACSSWPTAKALTGGANSQREARGAGGPDLQEMVQQWPTPMAGTPAQNGNSAAGNSDFSRRAEELAAEMWKTPDVPNGGRAMPEGMTLTGRRPDGTKGQVGLENQAKLWPTPSAMQDTKGDADLGAIERREAMGKQIGLAHRSRQFSRPVPATAQHGPTLSQLRPIWRLLRDSLIASHGRATWRRLWKGKAKRRLNPLFVEWLMGWPSGHALCACSATEFTLWQQDMRGALSALPTASGPWVWMPAIKTSPAHQMELI
jgi:hypothetical protein